MTNLSNLVTNQNLSERLKKMGVKQESIFYWDGGVLVAKTDLGYTTLGCEGPGGEPNWYGEDEAEETYSAFLSGELEYYFKFCRDCGSFNVDIKVSPVNKDFCWVTCLSCKHRSRQKLIRFLVDSNNGCWLWNGSVSKDGYGRVGFKREARDAYRVFYRVVIGEVPEGKELDHLCKNRRCVNPYHLEAVSHKVNSQRGARHFLTHEQVLEIRQSRGSLTQKDMAKKYGVTSTCIRDVLTGRTWS